MIVEGSENKGTGQAPVNVNVDMVGLADAIVQAQTRMAGQSQTASQPSKFKAHLEALAKTGEEGAAQAAGTAALFDSFKEDLSGEFANKTERIVAERLMNERNNQALKFVDDALEQYIGTDDDLKSMKAVMKSTLIETWRTAPELDSYRKRYDAGDVDYGKLRELALTQVNQFNKFRKVDGKERSASGVTTRDSSNSMGAGSDAAQGSIYKYEDLKNDKEKGIYNGALEIAQRRGIPARSEESYKFASKFVDHFRYPKKRKESA